MTKTQELAFRVRVDVELLDQVQNEVSRMRKFVKQERAPLSPNRRSAVLYALNRLQGKPS
jgi:hypothetical protein